MNKKKRKKEIKYVKAQIKLKNFVFVRHSKKEELTHTHSTLGSLICMEPAILKELNKAENYWDYGYDEKADLWGLGTKCHEMLIGRNGFNAESMKDLVNKVNKVE